MSHTFHPVDETEFDVHCTLLLSTDLTYMNTCNFSSPSQVSTAALDNPFDAKI